MSSPKSKPLLRLDASALEALFPEGSEARLDLQNKVVQIFAERVLAQDIDKQIKRALHESEIAPNKFTDLVVEAYGRKIREQYRLQLKDQLTEAENAIKNDQRNHSEKMKNLYKDCEKIAHAEHAVTMRKLQYDQKRLTRNINFEIEKLLKEITEVVSEKLRVPVTKLSKMLDLFGATDENENKEGEKS